MIASGLQRAATGQPSTLAVVGEPGIGKSRLAIEAAAAASAAGFVTLWGRAWEAGGAPAYWPWRQVCDGMSREGPIAQLWGRRGDSATDPDQARFDLFDAVTHAVAAKAGEAPLLCILDDLHAADVPSLELVAFATRHVRACRVMWLLTWRDAEGARSPVREPLARIAREATVAPLAALDDVDANELIDDVRHDADIELRSRVLRATGGNPLFLLETLAALATGNVDAAELEQLPLAQGIATIVHDRLAPLPAETRALAEAASVVGRDITVARWTAAAACGVDAVRSAAAELCEAGVLVPLAHDRWRFGHDLVREAIYRATNVVEIHGRLARDLDVQVTAGDLSAIGERAHHALHARGELRQVIDWTIAASDHARNQCAYEEAHALLELAMARLGARDAALQLALGKALLDLGRTDAAREAFTTAIALARQAGDPKMAALAAIAFGARYVFGDHPHDLIALIDQALLDLPETERELRARLLARKAAALTPAADPAPVLELARDAYRVASESPNDSVRLEVANAVGAAFADFVHPRERIGVNETVVELARAHGDRALELRGMARLITDYFSAGDLARADALIAKRDALGKALVQPRFAWTAPLFRSMRAMIGGDFATCDAAVAETDAYAGHDPNLYRVCAVHRTWLYLYSDRVELLRAHEPVILDAIKTMTPILSGVIRAEIRVRSGDLAEARRELEALDPEWRYGRGVNILATIGEVVAEVGSESARHDIYELLAPQADTFAAWGPFGLAFGPPIAATLGHLSSALGDLERARAHFESALAVTTAANACVGRAWSNYWYARAVAKAGDPDAARVVDDAIRDATRANIPGLVERCRAIGVFAAPAPARTAGPAPAVAWSMVEQAGSWLVTMGSHQFLVPNLRGMPMLARLAASPHVEIHSLELVSGSADPDADGGDSGELLDDKARAAYRKRLALLADQLDEAEQRGDVERAETVRVEHESLVRELSRAVGLGGKVRRAGAAGERARVAAQRRLREAIKKIGELDDELGAHLSKAIRTGTFCAYRP
jgi:tetratricopeptide (TPR) repeat protein